ncbi:hypothetical protein LCM23_13320 [Cytobacillus kochii]|uniref:hypothetical protein n=1 Tax=Cytobacillus kochii TaxID=859143 RepID=UPI001CD31C0E|nr:hypothetical protein [Cytobacillus kochii]MCA1027076.1 hypothetical protein [Cytobacillus kochii]
MVGIATELEKVTQEIIRKVFQEEQLKQNEIKFIVNRYINATKVIAQFTLTSEGTGYMSKVFKEGLEEARELSNYWKEQHEEQLEKTDAYRTAYLKEKSKVEELQNELKTILKGGENK